MRFPQAPVRRPVFLLVLERGSNVASMTIRIGRSIKRMSAMNREIKSVMRCETIPAVAPARTIARNVKSLPKMCVKPMATKEIQIAVIAIR